ncbi:TIGR03749 family integrating conjugative element protein [Sedimenticola selenatireducens]|uniref:TIGR03749 family integrating conjugative element protein n=1 Tax=Sedimenticola selenatireducens TaxID=191960 RepID=UPI00056AD11C|nr:TIGR03749 family integrating conjugative element protein [Sedimenticola selenatireducens]
MLLTSHWKIRWMCWLGLTLWLFQVPVHAASENVERIEWKKTPIRVELTVGQERQVEFPSSVKVGVPGNLQPLLRTQSVNGTVYLLAHAPFELTRVMVRETEGGQIYLFDISASNKLGQNHPIQLFVQEANEHGVLNDGNTIASNISYVTLTRFAARQLYAPARLLQDGPGIVRTPVARDPINLMRGGAIDATPLVAWRAGGYYLTSVKLTNRTEQPQTLDPRNLRGAWLTATFQHHRLLPAGNEADTTAVYLISARPFSVSF